MNKHIRHLAFVFTLLFLITAVPLQAQAAGDSSSKAETAAAAESGTQAEAAAEAGITGDTSAAIPFSYVHDPMENPKASKDIMVNPDAVYGYSPRPDSVRLKVYAEMDWSDADLVESAKQERIAYLESFSELYGMIEQMLGEGKNVEEIARAVSGRRNELRIESYKDDPEGLQKVKKSNLETYGNENGPTPDFLYEKYGSWQTVLEKALSSNPGMDACLGLYDEYYDTYDLEERSLNASSEDTSDGAQAEESGDTAQTEEMADADQQLSSYEVISGDTLFHIAEEEYGDGNKWNLIYEANKDQISDPDLIFPGQLLKIPDAA